MNIDHDGRDQVIAQLKSIKRYDEKYDASIYT